MVTFPSDSLFPDQWYLYNSGGLDLNVVNVWDDYTGNGVLVGVIDDGFDYLHYDLNDNYDTTIDYDSIDEDFDPFGNISDDDNHGTSVAGIIAAEANGVGSVGVAFNATITGIRAIPGSIYTATDALWRAVNFDVVNNSWGFGTNFFLDNFYNAPEAGQAIRNAVANGRDGLGTAMVFAAANSREEGDNTNYHNFQNSRYAITVAALNYNGSASAYSTPGASILVSAFGSGSYGSIVTTDRIGYAGYDYGDYTYSFNGTSAAAPMISGVVALMLEANPNLGYRDIQEILAYSAVQNDPSALGGDYIWQTNGAKNWNGGGLHVSHDYGFGLVDALAAVRLAETWQKQSRLDNEQSLSFSSGNLNWVIPDNNDTGISSTFAVGAALDIDFVEVELNLTHPYRGDLVVYLTSPSGIVSVLVYQPGNKEDDGDNIVFKLSSTQHWGESSVGNWTLTIQDLDPTDIGILNSWKLNLYGDADTANDTYFYTNEYGIYGATTLTDTNGIDTINAAAITSNSYLNLTPGSVSSLNGTALTISAGTIIENAFGGDGNDTIIGNNAANILYGGRGNDSLNGGAGNDTLRGGRGNDIYVINSTGDVITENASEGTDTVQSSFTYTLGANLENLTLTGTAAINGTGNSLNNNITGNSGNNILNGGAGNDTLNGGGGNNTLYGGTGNDRYLINSDSYYSIYEYTGEGIDTVESSFSFNLGPAELENLILTGTSAINGTGNSLNNNITGNSGDNTLSGDIGNDTLNGSGGNDTLYGGAGNDTLNGGGGNNTLYGGTGNDRYLINSDSYYSIYEYTGEGIDTVESSFSFNLGPAELENLILTGTSAINGTGNSLNNNITGNSGDNTLSGDIGNDTLNGSGGNDTLYGGAGNDTLNGGGGNNTLYGGTGNDRYLINSDSYYSIYEYTGEGIDTVESSFSFNLGPAELENLILTGISAINGTGNSLNNNIIGNSGNNTLSGNVGIDTLNGGTGNDILIGGTGNDILTGGTGADRFTFNSRTEGIDRITDFSVLDDTIFVSAAGFGGGLIAGAAITVNQFVLGIAATTSNNRFILNKDNGSLFFDQDGAGAIAKIQIATLNSGLSLTNADIYVVA